MLATEPPECSLCLEKTVIQKKQGFKKLHKRRQRMRWLDSITDSMDMHVSELQKIVKDRAAWLQSVVTKSLRQLSD